MTNLSVLGKSEKLINDIALFLYVPNFNIFAYVYFNIFYLSSYYWINKMCFENKTIQLNVLTRINKIVTKVTI